MTGFRAVRRARTGEDKGGLRFFVEEWRGGCTFFGERDATLDLAGAQLTVAQAGNKGVSPGERTAPNAAAHGLFGALMRRQVQSSGTISLGMPLAPRRAATATAGATEPSGTSDGKSGFPVRVAARASVDFSQRTTEAAGEDPGSAGTIRVPAMVPDGGASRESSVTDGETIVPPKSSEVAQASGNVQGPSAVAGEALTFAGSASGNAGKGHDGEGGGRLCSRAGASRSNPRLQLKKPNRRSDPRYRLLRRRRRRSRENGLPRLGRLGGLLRDAEIAPAEPKATSNPGLLQGDGGVEIRERTAGASPNSDGAELPSDSPAPELIAASLGGGEPATPAVFGKAGSPILPVKLRGGSPKVSPILAVKPRSPMGSPRAAIVDHHEKEIAVRGSTAGHLHAETIPTGQQRTAGAVVAAGGKPANTVASLIAGSPASLAAPVPMTKAAGTNSASNRTTEQHWTAGKAAAASPGEPLSARPSDLKSVPEPESGVISLERRGHAGATAGHSAGEGIGPHNTAEAQNSGVISATGTTRNSAAVSWGRDAEEFRRRGNRV